ncbi:MAG: hypothetical protein WAS07_07540, partial [Micropruina sp.]
STPSTDLPQLSAGGRPAAQVTPVIRQRARWIWPLTLGLIGAGLSGLALAESQGWIVPPVAYFSAALAAMAIGLVLSTWFGRPRGLLPTAILTGVATLVTLTPADRFVTGDYPRSEQLTFSSIEDLPQTREVNASATAIDLSTLPITADRTVNFELNAGTLQLTLPPTGNVEIDYEVNLGQLTLPGEMSAGVNLEGERDFIDDTGSPTLRINLVVNAGAVTVER